MPPKPKFTKEEIVQTALEVVSQKGAAALTARSLQMRSEALPARSLRSFVPCRRCRTRCGSGNAPV